MSITVEHNIKSMNTKTLALYLHSFQAQAYEIAEIESLLATPMSELTGKDDCTGCQTAHGCEFCFRAEGIENREFKDNYSHHNGEECCGTCISFNGQVGDNIQFCDVLEEYISESSYCYEHRTKDEYSK